MINARIDKSIKQFDVEGTPADVVVEFGYMINQYCSAVKKCCQQVLPALREAFAEAEEKLRDLGHIPLNPAALPEGLEKADYMRICLAMLDSADAIAPLLSWTRSDGAAIEMSLARYTDKKQIAMWWIP